MTSSMILFLIGGIFLIVFGFLLRFEGKKVNDSKYHGYGLIAIYLGFYLLIVGSSYTFLHKESWTDDSKQMFLYIFEGVSAFFAVLFGIGMLIHSIKANSKIGLGSAAFWTVASIAFAIIGLIKVSAMNDGWTKEKQKAFIDRCKSEDKYDCDCKLQIVKSTYPNPEDYNSVIDDEVENAAAINALTIKFNNQGLKCDSLKMKRETQKIGEGEGGLPADF